MKYINAEKLKEEIQPLYENAKVRAHLASQTGTSSDCAKYDEAKYIYEHILWLIDSLQQEQPEVDLEKEAVKFVQSKEFIESKESPVLLTARHFYELGLNERKG